MQCWPVGDVGWSVCPWVLASEGCGKKDFLAVGVVRTDVGDEARLASSFVGVDFLFF